MLNFCKIFFNINLVIYWIFPVSDHNKTKPAILGIVAGDKLCSILQREHFPFKRLMTDSFTFTHEPRLNKGRTSTRVLQPISGN